jgi:hypothetical protein
MGNHFIIKMNSEKKLRFVRVSYLEKFNRLAETIVDRRRSGGSRIHCHRNNMAIGNEPLGRRLEDGEFKSETRITDFSDPSMNMEDLVEKRPVAVLAKRFHIEKIDPGFEKSIVTVVNRFQVFSQGYIEVGQIVAEKDMSLLVCLDIANLDGMEKAVQVLRWVLLSHRADFSTNGIYVAKSIETGARNAKLSGGLISLLAFLACLAFLTYSFPASRSHS